MDCIEIRDGVKHFVPCGWDVQRAMRDYRASEFLTTLRLLLSAGFCLLLTCSTVTGDDIPPNQSRQWHLVSEPWCVNCPAAKAAFLAKGWPESNVLTVSECRLRFGFRAPYVPYEFGWPPKPQAMIDQRAKVVEGVQCKQFVPQRRGLFWRR